MAFRKQYFEVLVVVVAAQNTVRPKKGLFTTPFKKFEQLIHNFFGSSCLNIDVFDEKGKRYTPREWFIAPYEVIEKAIALIISGEIVKYSYHAEGERIVAR